MKIHATALVEMHFTSDLEQRKVGESLEILLARQVMTILSESKGEPKDMHVGLLFDNAEEAMKWADKTLNIQDKRAR